VRSVWACVLEAARPQVTVERAAPRMVVCLSAGLAGPCTNGSLWAFNEKNDTKKKIKKARASAGTNLWSLGSTVIPFGFCVSFVI
jgi:hypothetical protein